MSTIMRRLFGLLIATTTLAALNGAIVPDTALTPEGFAPAGWDLLARSDGDLNGDKLSDVALVFESSKEQQDESGLRVLVIAFREPGGSFRRSLATGRAIGCRECGGVRGDPFGSITIINQVLVISQTYGSHRNQGSSEDRFRFEHGFWICVERTDYAIDHVTQHSVNSKEDLTTGRVIETEEAPTASLEHRFFHLYTAPCNQVPVVDGVRNPGKWPDPGIQIGSTGIHVSAVFCRRSGPSVHVVSEKPVQVTLGAPPITTSAAPSVIDDRIIKPAEERNRSVYEARFGPLEMGWKANEWIDPGRRLWVSVPGKPDPAVAIEVGDFESPNLTDDVAHQAPVR